MTSAISDQWISNPVILVMQLPMLELTNLSGHMELAENSFYVKLQFQINGILIEIKCFGD